MNKAERALGGLEQVPSADDLAAALAGARRAGDLDEAVAQAQQEQKGLAAAVAERARALGVDAEDRARWRAAPSTQLVAELEARLQQHADRGRRLSDRKADLEQARVALDRDRATLRQGGDVPTEEQLGKARHDRDSAWKQLGAGPIADESAKDFERLVRGADALADRLRREADRVAKDARLAADDEANQQLLRQVDDALAACQADGAVLEAEWTASWSGVGVTPGSPVSMRDWLSLHAELMAESARADASQQQCELLVDRRASHLDELARALAACGDEAVVDEPLPPKEHRRAFGLVVDAAERRCAVLDERARERASLRAAIDEALSECSTLERRRAATERKLDKWRSSWAACMRKIRLPGDASIEQARAVVTITQRLFDQAASAQQMRGRIDGIERDAMQFASDVRLLLDQHLSEQVDLDAEPGAELLLRRYNTAKNDASQAAELRRAAHGASSHRGGGARRFGGAHAAGLRRRRSGAGSSGERCRTRT